MRIELDKVGRHGAAFAHDYQPEELLFDEEDVRLTRPLALKGRIERDDHMVRAKGSILTEAEVACDRCLQPINVPIATEFDVSYVPVTDYAADETPELHEEDLNVSVFDDETIDLDDLAREQVLLAMPSRSLCREDCKGLCPVCGINKNMQACKCEAAEVDPRWEALKDLRF